MTIHRTVLVTGATSGLGFEAAAQFLADSRVVVTGRTQERADAAAAELMKRTGSQAVEGVELNLDVAKSCEALVDRFFKDDTTFDVVLLNAGVVPGATQRITDENLDETFAASLVGHHRLTMGLLSMDRIASGGHIIISGSEAARGDVPMMNLSDLGTLAAQHFSGDLQATAEAMIRGSIPITFAPRQTYANTKMFVAWWAASLARELDGLRTVNAVSPGATPNTDGDRHQGTFMRRVMLPMMKLMPVSLDMGASVEAGAARYVEASLFDSEVTGQMWASRPKKMSGPMESMNFAHLHNRSFQDAAWAALAAITGVDSPS